MKKIVWLLSLALGSGAVYANPMRTAVVKEKQTPTAGKYEVGLIGQYAEYDEDKALFRADEEDSWSASPYVRYAVWDELTLGLKVPYRSIGRPSGADDSGLGDISVEANLIAYQDIFGFPYIMPYVEVFLPTGDDKEGLGTGEVDMHLGVAIGTTVADVLHWVVDARYITEGDDSRAAGGGALIWDLNKKSSLVVEGMVEGKEDGEDESRKVVMGGLIFRPRESLLGPQVMWGFYGGTSLDGPEEVIANVKLAVSF